MLSSSRVADPKRKKRSGLLKYDSGAKSARALAIIPAAIGIVLLLLQMPRAVAPETLPLPTIDANALRGAVDKDRARADKARREQLSFDVRALGTAVRELFAAQVKPTDAATMYQLRQTTVDKLRAALQEGAEGVASLRAVQLEQFLAEVQKFEATGQTTPELDALGGTFVRNMQEAGWTKGNKILLTDDERRVAYKLAWNSAAGAEGLAELQPTLDEMRVLYTLYLTRPHPPEHERIAFAAQREAAHSMKDCVLVDEREQQAIEAWRAEKVRKLALLDSTYPGELAMGIQLYRSGRFRPAAEAFQEYIRKHPDGPWALRARNHLKAAIAAQDL